jgi:NitT/TauT family transport system permease protein
MWTGVDLSPERLRYLRHIRRHRALVVGIQVSLLLAIFILWEAAAQLRWIDPFITSQPSRIIQAIKNLYEQGVLFQHIGVTCLETIIGFLLGTILGVLIAIALWWSNFLARVSEPYLVVLNSLPKIALGPVFIVWIGAGPVAIIVMTLAISLIVTILEVLNGFLGIDKEKIKLVQIFGGSKFQVLTKVLLPASFPSIINALKVNVGFRGSASLSANFWFQKLV